MSFESMMKKEQKLIALAVLSMITIWSLYSFGLRSGNGSRILIKPGTIHLSTLENISPDAHFSSFVLRAEFSNPGPNLTEHIQASIPPAVVWTQAETVSNKAPTLARVPSIPPRADASSLLLGVATTLVRLNDSLEAFAYWASGTGAHFIIVTSPSDDTKGLNKTDVIARATEMGLVMTVVESEENYIRRYVSLLEVFTPYITPSIAWCAIIDDDTFFPSMHRLLAVLDKYDTKVAHYVGGLTEDIAAVARWGYQAFGGAGIFLSVPLVETLQPHLNKCYDVAVTSGDSKIAQCIYRYTTAKLKVEPGLHQLDLMGDFSGFYEAARSLPVSLHHWKSWGHYDLVEHSKIAVVTGPDSIFQKYILADGVWMTHGFSIVKYSEDGDNESISRFEGSMERTFDVLEDETEKTFLHSLAPLRSKDKGKVQFMMEMAVEESVNTMSLFYVNRQDGVGIGVIRVTWTAG